MQQQLAIAHELVFEKVLECTRYRLEREPLPMTTLAAVAEHLLGSGRKHSTVNGKSSYSMAAACFLSVEDSLRLSVVHIGKYFG